MKGERVMQASASGSTERSGAARDGEDMDRVCGGSQ